MTGYLLTQTYDKQYNSEQKLEKNSHRCPWKRSWVSYQPARQINHMTEKPLKHSLDETLPCWHT